MKLMLKVVFPMTSMKGFAAKAFEDLKNHPYPEFTKREYYFKFGEGGCVMYVIYDITPGNEDAALKDINERVYKISQQVERWEPASMEILMSITEALALVQAGEFPG